ncbi:ubiquitin-protein ligase sel1 [Phlyctema vagabunda]|uniref:Ubiquitin-protein ligase sel1 n=1 Tax=Phlyctema vagabunda TaxID=108571 RepID=A0ABR4PJI9_9HELO
MRTASQWLILLVHIFALLARAQVENRENEVPSAEGSPQPSVVAQPPSPTPQEIFQGRRETPKVIEGAELVDQALAILHKYDRSISKRASRKPTGLLGNAAQWLSLLIPQLSIQGPASEGKDGDKKQLKGPLADGVRLLEQAAEVENPDALFVLAQMNFYGNFTHPKDISEAFKRYQQLASLDGNSSAQHMLGFMYATGIGGVVERDQAKALLYHTFAAQGGNARSEMTLAFRHHSGIGMGRSCDDAITWYKSVADKAVEWYRSGPPGGMAWVPDSYRLADEDGGVYGEGASFSSAGHNAQKGGVNSDVHAALDDVLEYLDLMSRKGDFKATFNLGRFHYEGQKDLPRNLQSAKWYFMKVAKLYWQRDGRIIETDKRDLEKTATKVAGYLGRMFLRGEGVDQSFDKALVWFNRGLKSGDAGSQYGLGLMYLHGLGVTKNAARATEFFKAAADQDYPNAQVELGALYLDQGTAADITAANQYFERAARYGHIEAFYYLAELIDQGIGRDRSCGLATAYYKNVAEKAEPLLSSFSEANAAYAEGDYELALIDYMFAAEQGYEKGQANVAYLLDQEKSRWTLPSWVLSKAPRPSLLQNAALALIYWTRSAKQTNIDSMVKMGDYYLGGIGTQADMEKAAACYTGASEFHQSAQALYNLGWMHENGVGLTQDFHLAKRFYDQALETNDEAYLPVTLSLFKLRFRSAWNTLTHGSVNSINDEPVPRKQWSLGEWINNFIRDDQPYYVDSDYDSDYVPDDPMPGGDADGLYEDILDDGFLESLIIIGLAAALCFLIYYRQQHQLAHRRENQNDAAEQPADQPLPGQQPDGGFFPQPGDPNFAGWAAGGIGH